MALVVTLIGVLVALAAQGALVLFLLNLGALGIDRGEPAGLVSALSINLGLLLGFGAIHSLMARPRFKQWWVQIVSSKAERGVYMLMSGLTLATVVHLWAPLPQEIWTFSSPLIRAVLFAGFATGLVIVFWSIFTVDVFHFHGFRQATTDASVEPPFAVRGPYRFARHPIQTGLIIALWSTPDMTLGHLLFAAGMTTYSLVATLALEEPDLRKSLGDSYRDYANRVPAIVPGANAFKRR